MEVKETNPVNDDTECLEDIYFSTCSDIFCQTLKNHGLVEPIRRIIIVGNIEYSKREEVKNSHIETIEQIQNEIMHKESKITGVLIVHENFFYHTFECSDVAVGKIIKATVNFKLDGIILGAKVVKSCGIINRYFKKWNSCVIKTPNYTDDQMGIETVKEESDIPIIAQMVKKLEDVLFVLASYVRYLKSSEFEEKVNELLPIGVLAFRQELLQIYREAFLLTVEEYVSFYLKPQDYVSYLEEEWPPNAPIHDTVRYLEEIETFEKNVEGDLLEEEIKMRSGKRWKKMKKKMEVVTVLHES